MNEPQPPIRVRELTFRFADPAALAELFETVLGLEKLRHDEYRGDTAIIMTDGYLQIALTSKGTRGVENPTPAIDHIGIQVDDPDAVVADLEARGWTEATYTQPATRFLNSPEGLELEIRSPGWGYDDVIKAQTQLYGLVPVENEQPLVHLPPADDATAAGDDGFVRVGRVADIPPGGGARVEIGGEGVFLFEYDGAWHAVQDACPHLPKFGRISEGQRCGEVLECPIHRSRFNLLDGSVLEPPARRNLKRFPIEVRGDEIMVNVQERANVDVG
jgi:nitrite reductase/ring-hydroxylating ferredoxin subunit